MIDTFCKTARIALFGILAGCAMRGNYTTSQVLAMNAFELRKVRAVNLCRAHYEARSSELVTGEIRRRRIDCRTTLMQSDGYDPGPEPRAQEPAQTPRAVRKPMVESEPASPKHMESLSSPARAATPPAPAPAQAVPAPASTVTAGANTRSATANVRRPDGLIAQNCVIARHGAGSGELFAKNACRHSVEAKGTCLPSPYANEDEPFPGTYTLDSWLFTLRAGEEQRESKAEACIRRGGKVLYIACHAGIPYFTTADAARYGCFR